MAGSIDIPEAELRRLLDRPGPLPVAPWEGIDPHRPAAMVVDLVLVPDAAAAPD